MITDPSKEAILRWNEERNCYDLYEVQNFAEVSEQFIKDTGYLLPLVSARPSLIGYLGLGEKLKSVDRKMIVRNIERLCWKQLMA